MKQHQRPCSAKKTKQNLFYMFFVKFQSEVNTEKQILQLSQRKARLVRKLEEMLLRVQSPDFMTKVPAHVRQQTDRKVSTWF